MAGCKVSAGVSKRRDGVRLLNAVTAACWPLRIRGSERNAPQRKWQVGLPAISGASEMPEMVPPALDDLDVAGVEILVGTGEVQVWQLVETKRRLARAPASALGFDVPYCRSSLVVSSRMRPASSGFAAVRQHLHDMRSRPPDRARLEPPIVFQAPVVRSSRLAPRSSTVCQGREPVLRRSLTGVRSARPPASRGPPLTLPGVLEAERRLGLVLEVIVVHGKASSWLSRDLSASAERFFRRREV